MAAKNSGDGNAASDKDLVARIAKSDKLAMKELYERHYKPLFAFLRGRGADPATAQDTAQDTMLEVWRSAERYSGQAQVKTWMFTIARNKLVDRHRRSARVTLMDEVPDSVDDSPDPEALTIAARDAERLRSCLGKLKAAHRLVIRMAFYEDLTYQEIAEIEGVPAGTVKTRIFHAKKLLLHCLGQR
ncbi:MAG: sigma-70 family RNA polymerase sigma factor [Pseudomonadota bacterium]